MIIYLAALVMIFSGRNGQAQPGNAQQSKKFTAYKGIVLDAESKTPVVFAAVVIRGTLSGTVTNSEGRFLIKIPDNVEQPAIKISSLGYETKTIAVSQLSKSQTSTIELQMASVPIEPVVIRNIDPLLLLKDAVQLIPRNYGDAPVMMTGFYRESIRKNRNNYKSVGEAILDIYKGSYKNPFDGDRVRIYKGRKSENLRRSDTIMVKFMGGPVTASLLDLVKNPSDILSPKVYDYYDYRLSGAVDINGRKTYVIQFDQKDSVQVPLYKGKIYIDKETKGIVSIDFEISPKQRDKAADYLILRKPATLVVDVISAHYLVNYRMVNDRWFLNYVRLEDHFSTKWKKKLFRSEYYLTSETAITDINPEKIEKPKFRESFKKNDFFSEKVSAFEDPEFWGPANVIEPEESIQEAIAKISKRLKRIQK
ncbi:MAG: hypothetical protein GXO83_13095 [Chlorobi bacterium]|nr:hypothetical protein [Chlorobiota bacterium]